MVLGRLGHAPETVDLRHQTRQGATLAQHLKEARGMGLHQRARKLLPHALGHQRIDFAAAHHVAHQIQGLRRHGEITQPCRKPRHAQNAHRVFCKSWRHMAQLPRLQISLAAVGIDQLPLRVECHCIDGQIAARKVFFERDGRIGANRKAAIARRSLALGARQRVFLAGLRMQKHREVLAHGQITLRHQLFGARAHHHPVAVPHRQPQQSIAHRTADLEDLHGASVGRCSHKSARSRRRVWEPRPRGDCPEFVGAAPSRRLRLWH